jgi:C-terminal processing protease CtpA/Prc
MIVKWMTLMLLACSPAQAMMLTGGVEESVFKAPEAGIVGMDIQVPKQGYPVVKQVFEAAPAAVAGLRQGDRIIKINGQLTLGKTAHAIDLAISDVPGTPISLTIERNQGQYRHVTLVVAPLSRTASHIQGQYVQGPMVSSRPYKG